MKNKTLQKQLYEVTGLLRTYEMANPIRHEDGASHERDRILKVLKLKPGIKKSELAGLFDLPPDIMKGVLKRLADDGYIVCNENPGNTKDCLLSLSEKGLQAWEETKDRADSKRILDCLTDVEKKAFSEILDTLTQELKKAVTAIEAEGFTIPVGHRHRHFQGMGHLGTGHGRNHHVSRNREECAGSRNCRKCNYAKD